MSERTEDGLAAARAGGRTGGQRSKRGPRQLALSREMYDETGPGSECVHAVEQTARGFGVIYRGLGEQRAGV